MAASVTQLLLRRLSTLPSSRSRDQGLSLVECLVAIAVIALTSALIAPPLFIASATRLQNQRAEQAFQIAQGEIDRVRTLVELGQHTPDKIPPVAAGGGTLSPPPPQNLFSSLRSVNIDYNQYTGQIVPLGQALPIDVDGDSEADFMMQTFRSPERAPLPGEQAAGGLGRPGEFQMGVRVYGKPAIDQMRAGVPLEIEPVSLQFTSGEGDQRTRPLAVLYSQINWSDQGASLCLFHRSNDASRTCRL